MTSKTTDVAIIMGSDSDLPIVEAAFPILESFGINYTKNVLSAHRTPHAVIAQL
jgi:phosphoribosylcarboxyaminoimidazole (NCAIR) mutase